MAEVEFHDYSIKVKDAINDKINASLEAAAGELESQVKRNSRVRTGRTKNSFRHKVDRTTHTATIGSSYQNAIWEEFGTGEYAVNGDGRKGGWWYPADKPGLIGKLKGKKPSKFIFTRGKKPTRAFWNAYLSKKAQLIALIKSYLGSL